MRVGINIQVSTIEGARYGLPALLDLLNEYDLKITGCFSPGPDRSVPWWQRLGGPPFISDIAREELLRLSAEGHEVGLAPFDANKWHEEVAHADLAWTKRQIFPGLDVFRRLYGQDPSCFSATGFQVNPWMFSLQEHMGIRFSSDVQGKMAFFPRAQRIDGRVPQLPVTLPTISDALRQRGVKERNVHEYLFDASQSLPPTGHVWRIDAELDGLDHIEIVEKMLVMWRGSQREIGPLGRLIEAVNAKNLPRHQIGWQRDSDGEYVAAQSVAVD